MIRLQKNCGILEAIHQACYFVNMIEYWHVIETYNDVFCYVVSAIVLKC